jgi:ribonuclease BN (tRNA processing enzyme)
VRLTLLGTQGWIPTGRRETTCVAVDDDRSLLVFDAGTGLRRLLEAPWRRLLGDITETHLFLTHYHLDHVCGLAYVPGIFAGHRLTVHVPEMTLNGVDPEKGIAELIRRPYNPRTWRELEGVTIDVLVAGPNDVAGHEVRVRPQDHPDTSVAYRLDDLLALATDTLAEPATAVFARGVGVLLHEAWIDGVEEADPDKREFVRSAYLAHSSARQAAAIAAEASVGELVLMHLNPLLDESYYRRMEMSARDVFAPTSVYPDLYQRELGG